MDPLAMDSPGFASPLRWTPEARPDSRRLYTEDLLKHPFPILAVRVLVMDDHVGLAGSRILVDLLGHFSLQRNSTGCQGEPDLAATPYRQRHNTSEA